MKIRTGFVSNSSSTSFCIMGVVIEADEIKAIEEAANKVDLWLLADTAGLDSQRTYQDSSDMIVGLSATSMKNDETLQEFKNRTAAKIKRAFPSVNVDEIDWTINGWYDG